MLTIPPPKKCKIIEQLWTVVYQLLTVIKSGQTFGVFKFNFLYPLAISLQVLGTLCIPAHECTVGCACDVGDRVMHYA